jgi:hypothetical protein
MLMRNRRLTAVFGIGDTPQRPSGFPVLLLPGVANTMGFEKSTHDGVGNLAFH